MSELLEKHGFTFQKKYGQNFLQDVKIPARIAEECNEYPKGENGEKIKALVLEIGPGAGILTGQLAERFEKVVAVEIDTSLKPVLEESLAQYDNAEIVFSDIMETDINGLLRERRIGKDGEMLPVCVCANLPYYITTPILMKLVETTDVFDYITVMVQKEVAARLTSKEASAEYGSITASLNLYGTAKRLFTVPSGCFFPRPKVDSAVVRISLYKPPLYSEEQIKKASKVIKAAFATRRKTLVNALTSISDKSKDELGDMIEETLGVKRTVRGEELDAGQFMKLAERLM